MKNHSSKPLNINKTELTVNFITDNITLFLITVGMAMIHFSGLYLLGLFGFMLYSTYTYKKITKNIIIYYKLAGINTSLALIIYKLQRLYNAIAITWYIVYAILAIYSIYVYVYLTLKC